MTNTELLFKAEIAFKNGLATVQLIDQHNARAAVVAALSFAREANSALQALERNLLGLKVKNE